MSGSRATWCRRRRADSCRAAGRPAGAAVLPLVALRAAWYTLTIGCVVVWSRRLCLAEFRRIIELGAMLAHGCVCASSRRQGSCTWAARRACPCLHYVVGEIVEVAVGLDMAHVFYSCVLFALRGLMHLWQCGAIVSTVKQAWVPSSSVRALRSKL